MDSNDIGFGALQGDQGQNYPGSSAPNPRGPGFVGGLMSVLGPQMQKQLNEQHQQKLMDMELHHRNVVTFGSILDENHSPVAAENNPDGTLSDAARARYQKWHDDAQEQLAKMVGGSGSPLKPVIQHLGGIMEKVTGKGAKKYQRDAAVPPPPTVQLAQSQPSQFDAPPQTSSPALPLPPATAPLQGESLGLPTAMASSGPALPPPPGYTSAVAHGGPALEAARQREIALQTDIAKHRGELQASSDVNLQNIPKVAQAQVEAAKAEVESIAPNASPEEKRTLLTRKLGFVPPMRLTTKVVDDPDSPTGASYATYDQVTGQVTHVEPNAFKPRGYIASETLSKDPFGNVSISTRTPLANEPGKPNVAPAGKPAPAGSKGVPAGQLSPGNVDLYNRPQVHNPQTGGTSTVFSKSWNIDGKEVLLPTVSDDGRMMSDEEAISQYKKTGKNLGTFDSPAHADAYAQQLHNEYAAGKYSKRTIATARPNAVPPPLDSDGHIPEGLPHVNQQVVENANQLLDGQDILKLPAKVRTPAAQLARQYGWEQGKFTPKEQTLLKESTTFLQQAATNDFALSALDDGLFDRAKMAQVNLTPDKEGFIGRTLSTAAAQSLTPKQVQFIQMYNQLVGTVSGLSQLVRSGRATEAQIERLKAELPNPVTTKDSADAKQRIQRLLQEVNVALEKGTFNQSNAKRPPALAAPPSGAPSTAEDYLKAIGAH